MRSLIFISRTALLCGAALIIATGVALSAGVPDGLTFYVSFDKLHANADFSLGEGKSKLTSSLELRSTEGVKGSGLLQVPGERCSYDIAGNFDTSQGTYSVWVKPLNWDGHGLKFRHLLTVDCGPAYRMLAYLYPIGDEAILNYVQLDGGTPKNAVFTAGTPVDILQKGEWVHLVTTWDSTGLRIYANGKRVGEGLVGGELPKMAEGTFTVCPIEYWKNAQWSDPEEKTICDEVRIFGRALTDDEVLDLYAFEVPGGLVDLEPALAVGLKPDYFGRKITVNARAVHLNKDWEARIDAGAQLKLTLADPDGTALLERSGALPTDPVKVDVPEWKDGDYTAEASLTAGGESLQVQAVLTKPPTPWLPRKTEWKADRVLEPWSPLSLEGETVRYWNGEVSLPGALPAQVTSSGEDLLARPVRLVADDAATWDAGQVTEREPQRVSLKGDGKLGELSASYETLMEFDGLVRADLTLTPPQAGVEVQSLTLEIPFRRDAAKYYRNPDCQEWDGQSLTEQEFIPYAWLGNEQRGLSWFMESAANWCRGEGKPAMTIQAEGDAVVVRLHLISTPTRITSPLTYTIGFEATPVRPLDPSLYSIYFASGPQFKGSNTFVYGWATQISYLNGRLLAYDPDDQRKLVDKWRERGAESLSYSCMQCTANISPEYQFFADEWNLPYGPSFSGYKRVPDEAPYSMVGVCPRSSFGDFLVWCATENVNNDWGGGIYTDIDAAFGCDNAAHGCGYTDAFGQSGRTWPLYAHRAISRRLYEACHAVGKTYFSHAHSKWYSLFNAFCDGWCPGEQYSHEVVGKPTFYMDGIPERVWRTEFYTPSTGVNTFLLPELGRLTAKDALEDRGPSECCMVAAMCYGAPLWAGSINRDVVEEVWAVQQAFNIGEAQFVPYWEQKQFTTDAENVRISMWQRGEDRLLVVANFSDTEQHVALNPAAGTGPFTFEPGWQADGLEKTDTGAVLLVPAKRGALIIARPAG